MCVHFTQDSDIQSALLADSREAISQILQESTTFHSSSFSLSLSKSSSRLEQSLTTITDQFESPDTLEIGDCFEWIHSLSHESAEILIHFLELSCPLLFFLRRLLVSAKELQRKRMMIRSCLFVSFPSCYSVLYSSLPFSPCYCDFVQSPSTNVLSTQNKLFSGLRRASRCSGCCRPSAARAPPSTAA